MRNSLSDNRITWIDVAKGYGTILVIFAHFGEDPLRTWMYSFHLPLFFFLSGYVFHTKYEFKDFFIRKCKSIVVPYFCLGISMVLYEQIIAFENGYFSIEGAFALIRALFLQQRLWTLWYIACLFCLNILFYVIVKLCKNNWLLVMISVLFPIIGLCYYALGGTPMYWNADVCLMAIPFFAAGYLYKLRGTCMDEWIQKFSLPCFIICAVVNSFSWRMSLDETGIGLEMFDSRYGNPLFTYLAAFAGIFGVIIVSKGFVVEPLRFIGENSMLYYAWHQTIMMPVVLKWMNQIGLNGILEYGWLGHYMFKLICLIGILAVTTICYLVINKLGLGFVLGKDRR